MNPTTIRSSSRTLFENAHSHTVSQQSGEGLGANRGWWYPCGEVGFWGSKRIEIPFGHYSQDSSQQKFYLYMHMLKEKKKKEKCQHKEDFP